MKPLPELASRPLILLALCLALTSCKENQQMQKQLDAANARVSAVQTESLTIDQDMANYRREIPAYAGTGASGAQQYAVQLATELAALETQVAQTKKTIADAEAALAKARQDLEALRAKAPR